MNASECVFYYCAPFGRDSLFEAKYYWWMNKGSSVCKVQCWFQQFGGSDAFVTRLNHIKWCFSSPRTMLARYWSASAWFVKLLGVPVQRRWAKTDHVHCENLQKAHRYGKDVRKLHSWPPGCLFSWIFFAREGVLFLSQCFEIPTMHKQAATSGLPISFYTNPESWISCTYPGYMYV